MNGLQDQFKFTDGGDEGDDSATKTLMAMITSIPSMDPKKFYKYLLNIIQR